MRLPPSSMTSPRVAGAAGAALQYRRTLPSSLSLNPSSSPSESERPVSWPHCLCSRVRIEFIAFLCDPTFSQNSTYSSTTLGQIGLCAESSTRLHDLAYTMEMLTLACHSVLPIGPYCGFPGGSLRQSHAAQSPFHIHAHSAALPTARSCCGEDHRQSDSIRRSCASHQHRVYRRSQGPSVRFEVLRGQREYS